MKGGREVEGEVFKGCVSRREGRLGERTRTYGFTRSWSKVGSAVSVVLAPVLVFTSQSYVSVFYMSILPYLLGLVNFMGYPAYLDGERGEGESVSIQVDGSFAGCMGLVNKTARSEWRLTGPIAAAELVLDALLKNSFKVSKVEELAQFPSMSRDIALVLDESVQHEDVVRLINKANPKDLERFGLFDVYQGKGIEKGKKSLAYTFTYRSAKQTLTDKKVNKTHQKLIDFLCKQLGATLREG